jgi:AraC-like DNA-binding protein
METIAPLIAGMTVGINALLILLIYARLRLNPVGLWLMAFMLCVAANLVKTNINAVAPIAVLTIFALPAQATAAAFFGFCQALFADRPSLRRWQWVYVACYLTLACSYYLQETFDVAIFSNLVLNSLVFFYTPLVMKVGLVLLALYIIVHHGQADLVEQRIRFRKRFLIAISIFFAIRQTAELVFGFDFPLGFALLNYSLTICLTLMFALWLLELKLAPLAVEEQLDTDTDTAQATGEGQEETAASALADQLNTLMEEQQVYTKTGLNVSGLADMLGTREYLLRRLINQRLGFRNFNHYLHKYRIAEAARRLEDPDNTLPILSIALDVGYSSINPFNRAFKDAKGETPSTYRKSFSPGRENV